MSAGAGRQRKKETIPNHVREEVWRRYGGPLCWCCQIEPISARNKHFGHIIAEAEGGSATVDNLRPVCASCNLRMRTQNMYDFMVAESYPLRDIAAIQRIMRKDPSLISALRGRELYVVPTVVVRGSKSVSGPEYEYVLEGDLLKKYSFLNAVAEAGNLAKLFDKSTHSGVTFHFVVRPEFVRWIRHKQEEVLLKKVEATLTQSPGANTQA